MVRIDAIAWTESMVDHIARHGVEPDDVEEVVFGTHHVTRGRAGTYRLIGQTSGGRFLPVIVAPSRSGGFAIVTARDATTAERRAYRHR